MYLYLLPDLPHKSSIRCHATHSHFFCNSIFFAYVFANLHFMNNIVTWWGGEVGGSNCCPIRQFAHMPFGQIGGTSTPRHVSQQCLLLFFFLPCSYFPIFFTFLFITLISSVHRLMHFSGIFPAPTRQFPLNIRLH